MPRATRWLTTIDQNQAIVDGGSDNYTLLGSNLNEIKGSTITRIIMNMNCRSDTLGVQKFLYWGLAIVTADALSAGGLPDPNVESDAFDWLGRGVLITGAVKLPTEFGPDVTEKLDLRSQRLFRSEDVTLQLIVADSGSGAGGQFFSHLTRCLVKLP